MADTQTPPPTSGGGTFLLDFFRTRPWAKRAVSIVSALLLIAGVALLAYPFATNLYQNRLQDKLELDTPVGGCIYQLQRPPFVVDKSDLSVLNPTSDKTLTLTSCHPKGSAAKRIIVKAVWVKDLQGA